MTTGHELDRRDPIGAEVDRIEALAKVTGRATYTGDVAPAGAAYAVMLGSTISSGRIRSLQTNEAETGDGVLAVLSHLNRPPWIARPPVPYYCDTRLPLEDDQVHFGGQCVALAIADTAEQAAEAAERVVVEYEPRRVSAGTPHRPVGPYADRYPVEFRRGEAETALPHSDHQIDVEYRTAHLAHAAMEPSATVASWEDGKLTLIESSQAVHLHRDAVAAAFGLAPEDVRVIAPVVGGAFGGKTFLWPHTLLAALASRVVGRPVRLTITRKQAFTSTGHMPATWQRIRLGARRDGRLTAVIHDSVNTTSHTVDRQEPTIQAGLVPYAFSHLAAQTQVRRIYVGTSTVMRAPGDTPGRFAVECALDELAAQLRVDPLELRRRNHSSVHPHTGKPWSANHLLRCYERGAAAFGWDRRTPEPGSMRLGHDLVGFGMAVGVHEERHRAASARVVLTADGTVDVYTGTQEIGGGTLTTMAQIAASVVGVRPKAVRVHGGDTRLPAGAPTFGSMTSGNTGSAVRIAAEKVRDEVLRIALHDPRSPFYGLHADAVECREGGLVGLTEPCRLEPYSKILRRNNIATVSMRGEYAPRSAETAPFAAAAFAAHFTEVRIDTRLPRVRVVRHVGVFDCGRVLNTKTATSQARGGIIFAIGGALMESLDLDPDSDRLLNPGLTDYHVPVNADVGEITPLFIDIPDTVAHPVGAKGLGEVCAIGVAPAVANAVFHATGKRVRDLPITPDKLLR
ncbi:xanthine dehydrogenase family protein molybdopterin-binding subunit [Amycolatopsis keratiniphila]|uniref:Aldehyde oxidase/xanthine dehydrogenase a/b hammerhead domain-containing protein n=1 Tax=Amycolatopsis keratiniphila subsp. keratiniphila TaxID=227715 RepID=A0A1W2M2V8_9PSEU|nr:xanthine dehydrogenase family protein molybdopterin-binding subunit [Amycolatopsis keratiniphila]ONF74376.1 hypothetical protein AVR91_0203560 [Amycolatopsis keratiniphila subsp. keratiniphila]